MRLLSGDPVLEEMMAIAADLGAVMSGFPKSTSTFLQSSTLQGAIVATSESTASAVYTDLATVGPSVTLTVGPSGVIITIVSANAANTVGGVNCLCSAALSGSNTVAATDKQSAFCDSVGAGLTYRVGAVGVFSGLAGGSTTVTMKYKAVAGTATFLDRHLAAFTY